LSNEFCPRCNALRNMKMISTVRVINDHNDEKRSIITSDFHCETCNCFVRSSFNEDEGLGQRRVESITQNIQT